VGVVAVGAVAVGTVAAGAAVAGVVPVAAGVVGVGTTGFGASEDGTFEAPRKTSRYLVPSAVFISVTTWPLASFSAAAPSW
jgi:hypothetical protein